MRLEAQQEHPMGDRTDRLRSVPEVANALRIGRATVYRLIERGDLPAMRIGGSLRVSESDLSTYVDSCYTTKLGNRS